MNNKGEHLGYIDFIKGVAIVSVILLHASRRHLLLLTHAYLHIWQAVPLFVFVSFFLLFRKMEHTDISTYFSKSSFLKLFRRILIPFIILQFFVLIYYYVRNDFHQIHVLFKAGGLGPGSYYPYLYLQLWLLAPFLYKLLKKNVLQWGG